VQLEAALKSKTYSPFTRLPIKSPFVLQIVFTTAIGFLLSTLNIFYAATANNSYKSHYKVLLERLSKNEAFRCFLADFYLESGTAHSALDDIEKDVVSARLSYLSDISTSISITMRNGKQIDIGVPVTAFGAAASVAVFTVLVTYNGLWVSVYSAVYGVANAFPQFSKLFLPQSTEVADIAGILYST